MSGKLNKPYSLRADAEAMLTATPPASDLVRSSVDLIHELQVHQIELEMQNETLRQSQLELEKSRDRYVDFYDFAPSSYLTLSHSGMIDEINLTGATLFGLDRNKLLLRRFSSFIVKEDQDRWYRHFLRVLKEDIKLSCEISLKRDAGSPLYAHLDCLRLIKDGNAPVVRIVLTDITERKLAEQALRVSEEKLHKITESARSGIIMMGGDQCILFWNPAAERIFGYSAAEALGQKVHALLAPAEAQVAFAQAYPHFQQSGEGGVIGKTVEVIALRKGGEEFAAELSISAAHLNGEWNAIAIVQDISERKKAVAQLKLFRDLIDQSSDEIYVVDVETLRFIDVNEAACVDLGYERDELLQLSVLDIQTNIRDRAAWQAHVGELRTQGRAILAFDAVRKDGSQFPVETSIRLVTSENRAYIIAIVRDITEQKKSIALLRHSEGRLDSIIRNNPYGIMLLDHAGMITFVNPAAETLYNKSAAQLIGQTLGLPLTDSGVAEITLPHQDGSLAQVEMRAVLIERGSSHEYIALFRDITQQRFAERALLNSLQGTIEVIALVEEMRDPYTAGHQRRVAELAAAIAREMGLDEHQVESVQMGAVIHDIGKIQLPAEILSKPTTLSDLEYKLIQSHAEAGYELLKGVDFPWPVANIAHQHHERLDGTGYPQGLKGDAICLEARIVAVADIVEAMSSHRPYRPGLGVDAALAEIENQRGIALESAAVDACLKLFREKNFSWTSYA